MAILFKALPTESVRALQAGGPDAYGAIPERRISDGKGVPCRHCLKTVADGDAYLILAYRPFPTLQPYAETGPIFLHAEPCEQATETADLPTIFATTPDYIVRGYDEENRIVYGSGAVVPTETIHARAAALFDDPRIDYLHVRSARNNCYQCRIERG